MNNQTRNHLNLQKHIADQDHIIRVRNAEIAALRKRAEKAERERDEWKDSAIKAMADLERAEQPRPVSGYNFVATGGHVYQNVDDIKPLTADDITDEMIERYWAAMRNPGSNYDEAVRRALAAALTEPPTRAEGAEKVEAVLNQYWSGDIDGDNLADRIVEEMNR